MWLCVVSEQVDTRSSETFIYICTLHAFSSFEVFYKKFCIHLSFLTSFLPDPPISFFYLLVIWQRVSTTHCLFTQNFSALLLNHLRPLHTPLSVIYDLISLWGINFTSIFTRGESIFPWLHSPCGHLNFLIYTQFVELLDKNQPVARPLPTNWTIQTE
jgi:hypothetical protein